MDKTPPHDMTAEASVLGAILIRPDYREQVAEIISPSDFYRPHHAKVYQAILDVETPDMQQVHQRLQDSGHEVGGLLVELTEATTFTPVQSAGRVRQMADRRALIQVCTDALSHAYDLSRDADSVVAQTEEAILSVGKVGIGEPSHLPVEITKRAAELSEPMEEGLRSCARSYDAVTLGFLPRKLYVLGADPGEGKTSKALSDSLASAIHGAWAHWFSLEMSKEELSLRALSSVGQIDGRLLLTHNVSEAEREYLTGVASGFQVPLTIDDDLYEHEQMIARARRLARKGCKLFVIDYLQKLQTEKHFHSEHGPIKYFVEAWKRLAKQENVTVYTLVQLVKRKEIVPDVSDLYGSKFIQNEADVIELLYPPGKAGEVSVVLDSAGKFDLMEELQKGKIVKCRHHRTGAVLYRFNRATTTYSDWDGPKPIWNKR